MDEILGKCLAKSPEDRYASTDELANALRTLLIRQHRPQKQQAPSTSSRSTVFALLAWSLICVLLLFAAVALVSWRLRIPESLWIQVETMVSNKMGTRVEQQPEPPPPDKKPINAPVIEPLKFQYNVAYKPANRPNIRRLRNGDVLSIGDTYRVSFTPEQNCHAYVYMVINGIDVMQLFPEGDLANAATGKSIVTNPVHKGQVHNLPASKPPYKINGPPGSRDLYFIATRGRNLEIEKFYKILKTARAQHDEKIIKIYRFKTRMRLKKTPVESTPEDHNITLPWEEGGEGISLVAQQIDTLCPDLRAHHHIHCPLTLEDEEMHTGERLHSLLQNTRWGKDFSAQEAMVIGERMEERSYIDGERILNLGGEDRLLHVIVSGKVHIVKDYETSGGEKPQESKSISLLGQGTVFGEISLVDHLPNSASAIAKGPVTILVLHGNDYDSLLQEKPAHWRETAKRPPAGHGSAPQAHHHRTHPQTLEHFTLEMLAQRLAKPALQAFRGKDSPKILAGQVYFFKVSMPCSVMPAYRAEMASSTVSRNRNKVSKWEMANSSLTMPRTLQKRDPASGRLGLLGQA